MNEKNLAFRKLTELNCRPSNLTILYHRNQSCDRSQIKVFGISRDDVLNGKLLSTKLKCRGDISFFLSTGDLRNANEVTC